MWGLPDLHPLTLSQVLIPPPSLSPVGELVEELVEELVRWVERVLLAILPPTVRNGLFLPCVCNGASAVGNEVSPVHQHDVSSVICFAMGAGVSGACVLVIIFAVWTFDGGFSYFS